MCKIAIFPSIPEALAEKTLAFAKALTGPMTATDRDAFGVAAVTEDNQLYAGRWIPRHAWQARPKRKAATTRYSNVISKSRNYDETHLERGVMPKRPRAMLLHSRWATSGKGLANAHPHVSPGGDVALVHNGIVDAGSLDLRRTQCDSEGILNAYTDACVQYAATEWQSVADRVRGYYACGVLALDESGNWIVDVIRDSQAQLYYCEVDGVPLFVTDLALARSAAKATRAKLSSFGLVQENSIVRINVADGVEQYCDTFVPLAPAPGKYQAWRSHMGLDAGDTIDLTQDDGPRYTSKYSGTGSRAMLSTIKV